MDSEKSEASGSVPPKRKWRRAVVATSVLGAMLFSGAAILPTALLATSYRDSLLNSKLEKHGLKGKSQSGSGSWITPIVLEDVEIFDDAGHVNLNVERIHVSNSIFSILLSGDLGTVTVDEPQLVVALDENGNLPLKKQESTEAGRKLDMDFDIRNADFTLAVPWRKLPIVEVNDIDIAGDISTNEEGRWLSLQPVTIYDHEPLSETHSEQNLALIAPVLSQSTRLEGEVSVALDAARFQLDAEEFKPFPIRGHTVFHSVSTRLKEEWAVQVAQLLRKSIGTSIPNRLLIARDSSVAFEVDDRGIHHHGLGFLLPDISTGMVIESSGMVGLDETLDLALSMQLPHLRPTNPLTAALSNIVSAPFQLQVTGTVDKPELITPPGFSLVDQMSLNANPAGFSPQPKPVGEAVMDLIGNAAAPNRAQAVESLPGSILEMIRAAREAKKNAPPKEPRVPKRNRRPRRRDRGE